MSDDNRFSEFLKRIRAGDQEAAAELVRQYEPLVRREIRFGLHDSRLRRVFDSMDVCQSVLASFFLRAAAGSYDLAEPKDLVRLLVRMAKNKLASAARKQYRKKRNPRHLADDGHELLDAISSPDPSPSAQIEGRELLQQLLSRLSTEERTMVDLRAQDQPWADIAATLGGTAQARRVQLARAVKRVSQELGLDDDGHG